jgi:glutathione S-transferase
MDTPTLLTITISHYCEKARWGLDRAGIAYEERRHAPGFHVIAARRRSGKSGTPILATADGVISDSTNILIWADNRAAPGRALYPKDPSARAEVLALEDQFDEDLGPHVRRVAYHHLLSAARLILPLWTHGVPTHERLLMPLIFTPLRALARRGMRIDAAGAARSIDKVRTIMNNVGDMLKDGRPYLTGGEMTAADITFAALAAPILWPEGYGVPLPPLHSIPPELMALVRELRDTPAGAFGLRLYRDDRGDGEQGPHPTASASRPTRASRPRADNSDSSRPRR